MLCSVVYIIYFGFGCDIICIRVTSVKIIIITHSARALFDLNAPVSSLGGIVLFGTIPPWASTRAFKSNSALSLCVIIIILYIYYIY